MKHQWRCYAERGETNGILRLDPLASCSLECSAGLLAAAGNFLLDIRNMVTNGYLEGGCKSVQA